jgi:hypothetical protein
VGTIVVVSLLSLLLRIPVRLLSTGKDGVGMDIGQLAVVLFVYACLNGPFDFLGGYILPKKYGRTTVRFPEFLRGWLRGVLLHSLVLMFVALALLNAARTGGFPLVLGAFLGINIGLLVMQTFLAKIVGLTSYQRPETESFALVPGQPGQKRPEILLAVNTASYFTGGITGLPGQESILLPERWLKAFSPEQREAILLRRVGVLRNGSRTRGLLLAMGWNLVGFCLAYLLSGHVASIADLVTFSLWFTLWNFLGLLVLPRPSQNGVFGGDAFALQHGVEKQELYTIIQQLDRDQDDEYSRSPGVETYFHPLPSVERRVALLDKGVAQENGAWHAARMAIYLSWAGVSFLSRAVHCNCGRPDVWVFLPCD